MLKKTNVRNLKQVSNSDLQEKFCELKVSNETDINTVCKLFENDLRKIIDELAPITEKAVRDRTSKPWFNADINQSRKDYRKCFTIWQKHKDELSWWR